MDKRFDLLARDLAEQRLRARAAEERLRDMEQMLAALGLTLWCTDSQLRLTSSYGMQIAESYIDCHIGDFYRDVYGVDEAEEDPVAAHVEARSGRGVTLSFHHADRIYAMLVEPKRDDRGEVVGTVGMAVDLTS